MNSFDFSIYDPEDNTVSVKVKEPENQKKQPKEEPKVADFDFGQYDYDQAPQENPKTKNKNPFEVAEVSKEDYAKMSMAEKMQYAKDLEKEQKYNFSKGFTKKAASALTYGASENIQGFETEEDDDAIAGGFGNFVGSTAPILASGGIVGAGLKTLGVDQLIKNAPRALQALYRVGQAFSTGAVYESGQQGVNAATGKDVDLTQIPIRGAEFATIDSIIKGAGALGKKFLKVFSWSPSSNY
jgi:hypothetical protein